MPNKKTSVTEYVDPTGGLTNRELEIASWYVRHVRELERILIVFLLLWSIATIGFGLWQWGKYLVVGYDADQKLLDASQGTNYAALHAGYAAKDIVISDIHVFRSGKDKYDFVADITNPNARFVARVEYKFIFAGGETLPEHTTVLPGQTRPMASFGFMANPFPGNAQLKILSIRWWRVNAHMLEDVQSFMKERLQFSTDEFVFQPMNQLPGVSVPSITLTVFNDSAYSYWQSVFYIDLRNGGSRVGLVSVTLDQFRAGQKRAVDVRLFGDTPTVTDIIAYPIINVFDPAAFMKPGE